MRTTIEVDDELLRQARELAAQRRLPLRVVLGDALREGLVVALTCTEPTAGRSPVQSLGLRPGINLDNIHEVLAYLDGEPTT
ncbi:MAG: CopG family transcriptional regulator [Fimbriimonadaceae bacterium]|nr:CopG family transcriptional regulator [Fimbriimonadaceae bacterium]